MSTSNQILIDLVVLRPLKLAKKIQQYRAWRCGEGIRAEKKDHQDYNNINNVRDEKDVYPVASMVMPSTRINGGYRAPSFLLPIASYFVIHYSSIQNSSSTGIK
eukprot:2690110-Ditylum_brightwellii.AAC.2